MGIHDGHRGRMRARFLKDGLEGFAPHEALELLLYYGIPQRNTNDTAHALIDRYGSLSAVLNAPLEDLRTVKGLGEYSAVLLKLVPEICAMARMEELRRPKAVLNSTDAAGSFMVNYLSNERTEVICLLCLDAAGRLICCKRLEEGSVSRVYMHIYKVVEAAVLHSASRVILGHNHPGGDSMPSEGDVNLTDRVKSALAAIEVVLDDHIIVAGENFTSMRQLNLL